MERVLNGMFTKVNFSSFKTLSSDMQVLNTTELMIREEQNITAYDLNVYYYLKDTRITYE
jgi:hypothetical protein